MNNPIKGTTSLLKITIVGAFLVGLLLSVFGVLLVYLGATGDTKLDFFGQKIESTNIGIAAIFIGAALIILLVRRSLKSLDTIADRSSAKNQKVISKAVKNSNQENISIDTTLLITRNEVYKKLWKITDYLPKWPRSNKVTYEQLTEFSTKLKEWYFDEGGMYLSLSPNAGIQYAALQESLTKLIEDNKSGKMSIEDYESIMGKCSKLRTAMTQDIKSR